MQDAVLVYDGECPFCSTYVRMLRLRDTVALRLVDARSDDPGVSEIVAAGFDLDEGMVLSMGGSYFHGHECVHALALLSTSSGAFNRINALIFGSRAAARLLYPVLRLLRNVTLLVMGRQPLDLRA